MFNIEEIKDPSFLKDLNYKEKKQLAKEIREFLITKISKTGGHLSSNLGIVELEIALKSVFSYEDTLFLYDVGHQSYIHKIFTGRAKEFDKLRKIDGLSGYINKKESEYDIWESGHSSTTISAMTGLLLALGKDTNKRVISIIGDGSIVSGVAFEALNHLGRLKDYKPIIILNDNGMGISKNVGSMSKIFDQLRSKKLVIKSKRIINSITPTAISNFYHQIKRGVKGFFKIDNIFEDLGFNYYGPVDGNNLKAITKALKRIKNLNEPVVLHVITKKGLGYPYAEDDEVGNFHGVEPFNIATGKALEQKPEDVHSFSEIVASSLLKLRRKEEFYVITPAMVVGAKLTEFQKEYKDYLIDVGIAEEHATILAAGLTIGGKKTVLLMYSTFSQRAFDFLLNDVARQDLPVIIGIDRAGVVGGDGATHEGIYDVSMFNLMPNVHVLMPKDENDVISMFNFALHFNHPLVIRYPRSSIKANLESLEPKPFTLKWQIELKGNKGIVIAYGPLVNKLKEIIINNNLDVYLINACVIKPIDINMLETINKLNLPCLFIEEVVENGSLYQVCLPHLKVNAKAINFKTDTILPFGDIKDVLNRYHFNEEEFLKRIKELYEA